MFTLANLNTRRALYRAVFTTPDGKKVLRDLMQFSKFFQGSYVKGDPSTTAFNEGMRQMILRIITVMDTDPVKQQEILTNILRDTDE